MLKMGQVQDIVMEIVQLLQPIVIIQKEEYRMDIEG